MKCFLFACVLMVLSGCGVDRLQHNSIDSLDETDSGSAVVDAGETHDAAVADAGADAGHEYDAGAFDSGVQDAGTPEDAGSTEVDAGFDAGTTSEVDAGLDAGNFQCTVSGISPQLAALTGGPYQNCQGGTIPRTDVQDNTQPWSGCCVHLIRLCMVTGYSTQNAIYCQ